MDSLTKMERLRLHGRCLRRRNSEYYGSLRWHCLGILRVFGDALRDAWMGWRELGYIVLGIIGLWLFYLMVWAIFGGGAR